MDGYRFNRTYLAPSAKATAIVLRAGLRVQLAARRHDLLHVHGEVAGMICLPGLALRSSVITLHGLNLVRRLHGRRKSIAAANLRLLVKAASRTICVSQNEYDDVLGVVGSEAAGRLAVIRNGVEAVRRPSAEDRAALRTELGIPADAVAGVLIGALEPHKDPLVPVLAATHAMREGMRLVLLVAGTGGLQKELEACAGDAPAGTIRALGFRPDADGLLAAADFFVLPSLREGLSFALLEAMSLGLPCVVSDAPGNVEAVGDAGIIVRRGDVAGFERAFRRLLDRGERVSLGRQAHERVTQHFSVGEMVRQTERVYDEVVRTSSKAVPD